MAELSELRPYGISAQGQAQMSPASYFDRTPIPAPAVDTSRLSKAQGKQALMGTIARILETLPKELVEARETGKKIRTGDAVRSDFETLRAGGTPPNGSTLADFKASSSGDITYSPEDPGLRAAKITRLQNFGKPVKPVQPSLYDRFSTGLPVSTSPLPALGGGGSVPAGASGGVVGGDGLPAATEPAAGAEPEQQADGTEAPVIANASTPGALLTTIANSTPGEQPALSLEQPSPFRIDGQQPDSLDTPATAESLLQSSNRYGGSGQLAEFAPEEPAQDAPLKSGRDENWYNAKVEEYDRLGDLFDQTPEGQRGAIIRKMEATQAEMQSFIDERFAAQKSASAAPAPAAAPQPASDALPTASLALFGSASIPSTPKPSPGDIPPALPMPGMTPAPAAAAAPARTPGVTIDPVSRVMTVVQADGKAFEIRPDQPNKMFPVKPAATPKPVTGMKFASADAAREAGYDPTGAKVNADGSLIVDSFKPSGTDAKGKSKITDAQKNALASATVLAKSIDDLMEHYDGLAAKGMAGPVGGRIEKGKQALGMGSEEGSKIQAEMNTSLFKIARMLNGAGVLTDKDIQRATATAPTLTMGRAQFKGQLEAVKGSMRDSLETWMQTNAGQATDEQIALAKEAISSLEGKSAAVTKPSASGSSSDEEAMTWANANPGNPLSAKILAAIKARPAAK